MSEHNAIGMAYGKETALCWSLKDVDVVVKMWKLDDDSWAIEGTCNGERRINAVSFGGKHRALRYARFIRNGLVSQALRKKRLKENKKVREEVRGKREEAKGNSPTPN